MLPPNYDQNFDSQFMQNFPHHQQPNPEEVSSNQFHSQMVQNKNQYSNLFSTLNQNYHFKPQMMSSDQFSLSVQNHQYSSEVMNNIQYNYPVMPSQTNHKMVINNINTETHDNNVYRSNHIVSTFEVTVILNLFTKNELIIN